MAEHVVYADKTAAINRLTQIERDLGFPRQAEPRGPGIHGLPEESIATKYADLLESVDGKNYAFPVDAMGKAVLSEAIKARIQDLDPKTWAKPLVVEVAVAQAEEVLK
jgi:hypothetical protein